MLATLNSLNALNLSIFQPILMILISKFVVHRALSDKIYLLLGMLSPLTLAGSLGRCLITRPDGLVFKPLPQGPANIMHKKHV